MAGSYDPTPIQRFALERRSPVAGKQGACDVHETDDFYSHEFLYMCSRIGVDIGGVATFSGSDFAFHVCCAERTEPFPVPVFRRVKSQATDAPEECVEAINFSMEAHDASPGHADRLNLLLHIAFIAAKPYSPAKCSLRIVFIQVQHELRDFRKSLSTSIPEVFRSGSSRASSEIPVVLQSSSTTVKQCLKISIGGNICEMSVDVS